jgi:predicted ATPase
VDAFAAVAELVDHGLLRVEPVGSAEPRYRRLETIREFGLERLAEAGDERSTRDAHAA